MGWMLIDPANSAILYPLQISQNMESGGFPFCTLKTMLVIQADDKGLINILFCAVEPDAIAKPFYWAIRFAPCLTKGDRPRTERRPIHFSPKPQDLHNGVLFLNDKML